MPKHQMNAVSRRSGRAGEYSSGPISGQDLISVHSSNSQVDLAVKISMLSCSWSVYYCYGLRWDSLKGLVAC